jgi:hypothetical protein
VTARTSSFSFKGKEIGIRRSRERCTSRTCSKARCARPATGADHGAADQRGTDKHLWSQTYDRKLDDIFAIQDEIAADVVKQLKVTLLGAAPEGAHDRPEAYSLYLQAVELGRLSSAEGWTKSDALLKRALEIDPNYAPAWDSLARNNPQRTELGTCRVRGGEDTRTRVREAGAGNRPELCAGPCATRHHGDVLRTRHGASRVPLQACVGACSGEPPRTQQCQYRARVHRARRGGGSRCAGTCCGWTRWATTSCSTMRIRCVDWAGWTSRSRRIARC